MDDVSTLLDRIDLLLEAPAEAGGDSADVRAHMESTLTDGYARALALECRTLAHFCLRPCVLGLPMRPALLRLL